MQDLTALRQYIAQDNPFAANQTAKQILKSVNLLTEQPDMGRTGRIHNTRELVISGFPYIVPYQVTNNMIIILRVLHGAMEWPVTFKKRTRIDEPEFLWSV